jgi:hypothetical protein
MAINTNLKSLTPRRDAYKKEITLVSGGFYAPQAFPQGKITVYPWDTAIDAWYQERQRQPKPEYVLWEAAEKIANLNGVSHKDMPFGDILTILMVSRSILSDCVIEYVASCPACATPNPGSVRIPDELSIVGKKAPDFKGTDTITLPECKDVVELRVMTVGDEISVMDRSDEDKALIPDTLALILHSIATVGGGRPDNKEEVLVWYNALSPKDAEFITKKRAELTPQLERDITIECDKCKAQFKHTLEIHREFFRRG